MSAGGPLGVPIKIVPRLPKQHNFNKFTIKIEGLISGARISKGQIAGDHEWSLTLDQLDDLYYLPPGPDFPSHAVQVRLIGFEDDFASTIGSFELEINPKNLRRLAPAGSASPAAPAAPAAVAAPPVGGGDNSALEARLKQTVEAQVAEVKAAATAAVQQQVQAAQQALKSQIDERLANAKAEWERENSDREAKLKAAFDALQQNQNAVPAAAAQETAVQQELSVLHERLKEAEERASTAEAVSEKAKSAFAEALVRAEKMEEAVEQAQSRVDATQQAEIQKLQDDLAAAEASLQARERERVTLRQEAVSAMAEVHARQMEEVRAILQEDMTRKISEARELQALELERQIGSLRESHAADLSLKLTEAEATYAAELARKLKEAGATNSGGTARHLEQARQSYAGDMAAQVAEAEVRLKLEFDAKLAEELAALERDATTRLGDVERQLEAAVVAAKTESLAATATPSAQEHVGGIAAETGSASMDGDKQWQDALQRHIDEARKSWEEERAVPEVQSPAAPASPPPAPEPQATSAPPEPAPPGGLQPLGSVGLAPLGSVAFGETPPAAPGPAPEASAQPTPDPSPLAPEAAASEAADDNTSEDKDRTVTIAGISFKLAKRKTPPPAKPEPESVPQAGSPAEPEPAGNSRAALRRRANLLAYPELASVDPDEEEDWDDDEGPLAAIKRYARQKLSMPDIKVSMPDIKVSMLGILSKAKILTEKFLTWKRERKVKRDLAAAAGISFKLSKQAAKPVEEPSVRDTLPKQRRGKSRRLAHGGFGGRIMLFLTAPFRLLRAILRLLMPGRILRLAILGGAVYASVAYYPTIKPYVGPYVEPVLSVIKPYVSDLKPYVTTAKKYATTAKNYVMKNYDYLAGEITTKVQEFTKKKASAQRSSTSKRPAKIVNVPSGGQRPKASSGGNYIKPAAIKLRADPTQDAEVAGYARRADRVDRLAVHGNWVKVRILSSGKVGWVHKNMLTDSDSQ